jgi:hypothetical protein
VPACAKDVIDKPHNTAPPVNHGPMASKVFMPSSKVHIAHAHHGNAYAIREVPQRAIAQCCVPGHGLK